MVAWMRYLSNASSIHRIHQEDLGCAKEVCKMHGDNAPVQTSELVQMFLDKKGTKTLSHPPYSPDLALPDFFLFPKCKKEL
eukprot:snap_masked-scaffold2007_size22738-processed-gene-0.2 protein:Tk00470 transcript:snap_masked-scaffold2007_size22738-processed-gene-0.2-mRNA-1 annotation:"hypothetical protein X777_03749"